MASSNAVSLDTVMIKIESDAGKSTSNINNLANSLGNLKSAIKGGFNGLNNLAGYIEKLNTSATGLNKTAKSLDNLASITDNLTMLSTIQAPTGLNKTIQRLNELATTSETLSSTSEKLQSVGTIVTSLGALGEIKAPSGLTSTVSNLERLSQLSGIDNVISEMQKVPQLVEPLSKLGDIVNPIGMKNAISNLEKLPEVLNKIDATTLENLKRVSSELATSLQPLAEAMGRVADGYSAFSKIQNTFGKSASTSYKYMKQHKSILSSMVGIVKKVSSSFLQMGNNISSAFGKKAISNLKSFHSKFKQIFLSLLGTRTLFTMIRKAASEYEAFDTSLQKFSQNVWRAFGAQLAPVIEYVMNLFKQFVRVIYSIVYALTGIDLIAKANEKAMQGWGSAAKDTLGNLQKFDDLNVVEFSDKSSGDDNELIDMDKIDLTPIQKIIDWVKQMKQEIQEALDTGKWYNVGKVFADGIGEGIDYLLSRIPDIREKLFEVATDFGDFLNGVIENTNWSGIGKLITEGLIIIPDTIATLLETINWDALGDGINEALSAFDPVKIINSFMGMIDTFVDGIVTALLRIEWGPVGKKIGDSIIAFFSNLSSILDGIPWNEIGKKVREAIENVNWKEVWDSIVSFADSSFSSLTDFISGLTGIDSSELDTIAEDIELIGKALITYKIAETIGTIVTTLTTGASAINPWVLLLSGIVSIITSVKEALDAIEKGDYEKVESIANALKLMSLALLAVGVVVGVLAILKEKFGDVGDSVGDAAKSTKDGTKGFSSLFKELGKAAEIIAILGGLALVLNSITDLLKTFGETGMSVSDAVILIAGAFAAIALGVEGLKLAISGLSIEDAAEITLILVGLCLALESLADVFESIALMGDNASDALNSLAVVMVSITALVLALAVAGQLLQSPLALAGVAVVALSIMGILEVMAATLPTILDACAKFINEIGPFVIELLQTIGDIIEDIIKALGESLPPIINSLGNLFNKVFKGIADIIKTVGNTIEKIMKTADKSINNVLGNILKFINELGPAINHFVDEAITATTKLINFVVSGVEWLINIAIVTPINELINKLNKNAVLEKLGWQLDTVSKVQIERFAPKLETGTNEIPREGLYHLHPGEAVVPKKYNPALGNGGSEELNEKLDTLINMMNNMKFTNIVNVGNKTLYKEQQSYNSFQNNKYGTINI